MNKNMSLTALIAFFVTISINNLLAQEIKLSDLTYPYNTLTTLLPFDNHGWYGNSVWIEKLIKKNNVKSIVEIGSWLGLSTRHMASILPNNGKLYAIDTWEGSVEHHQNSEWSEKLPTLYQQFLSNIVHAGLTDTIFPIRAASLDAISVLRYFGDSFDLIYIDAAHDTQSVLKDLEAYFPLVADHKGILCGDDWEWNTVRIAVLHFAQKYNLTVYADYNFWFLSEENEFALRSLVFAPDSAWLFPKINLKK